MKNKKLNEMSSPELEKELSELKSSLDTNGLDNPMRIREVRREIARVKTIIRKNELNNN